MKCYNIHRGISEQRQHVNNFYKSRVHDFA